MVKYAMMLISADAVVTLEPLTPESYTRPFFVLLYVAVKEVRNGRKDIKVNANCQLTKDVFSHNLEGRNSP